jgi:O-antigen ligase
MHSYIKEYRLLFLLSLSVAVLLALVNTFLIYLIIGLLVLLITIYASRNTLVAISIVALLTLVSDIGVSARTIVQLYSIGILFILFFKEFGFDWRSYKSVPSLIRNYMLLLFASLILSSLNSHHMFAGFELTLRTLVFFIIVYILFSFTKTSDDIKNLLTALIITCFLISISVIYEFVSSGFWFLDFAKNTYMRISGIISNVNATGGYFSVTIPLTAAVLFHSELRKSEKGLVIFIYIFLFVGLLLTTSRSAFISVTVSLITLFLILKRKMLKWFLGILGLIVISFIFIQPINNLITLLLRLEEGVASRDVFWKLSWNIISDNTIFGLGPGSFKYEVINYIPVLLGSWHGSMITRINEITGGSNSSHNFFLVFFSDMGILGLLSAVLLPVIFYSVGIPLLKKFKEVNQSYYVISSGIIAVGTGLFVRAFFEGLGLINYGYITTDLPFWICFIILIHLSQIKTESLS